MSQPHLEIRTAKAPSSSRAGSRAVQQALGIIAEFSYDNGDTPITREKTAIEIAGYDLTVATDFAHGAVGVASHTIDQTIGERVLYIHHLVVKEGLRGRGIGSMVLTNVLEQASALQCSSTRLFPSEAAVPFYLRHGFVLEDANDRDLSPMVHLTTQISQTEQPTS